MYVIYTYHGDSAYSSAPRDAYPRFNLWCNESVWIVPGTVTE